MTKNPFPGMNPFFEQRWRDAHSSLITYLRDALQERLPPDLIVGAEEEVITIAAGDNTAIYRPDVQVRKPWSLKEPAGAPLSTVPSPTPPAAEPIRVYLDEEVERWLEIRDATGRLITVIELLSPTNKLDSAERERYLRKCRSFMNGGVNLVEIDLVRQGSWVFPCPFGMSCNKPGPAMGSASSGLCVWPSAKSIRSPCASGYRPSAFLCARAMPMWHWSCSH